MTTVYLVRHGEAAASWGEDPDPGLSELGHQQALAARDQLVQNNSASRLELISSPLLRARETAQPLARALKKTVRIDDRFREIPSPVPIEERQTLLRRFMRQTWAEQDEPLHAWRSAILQGICSLDAESVIFSHFLVINAIVGEHKGAEKTLVAWPANASISRIEVEQGKIQHVELGEQIESRVN